MRKKIVAANWKMNLTLAEGKKLVEEILKDLPPLSETKQVIIAPSFVHLTQTVASLEQRAHIFAAAQNCSTESSGAFTGEVSALMLQSAGVEAVIIGHSERRAYFNESDQQLTRKIEQALANNLRVIFCCGEPLDIRDGDKQNDYIGNQLEASLFGLNSDQMSQIIIAYEPIWAIGTGRTATSRQAQEMHSFIRGVLQKKYGNAVASQTSLLYGGSCNAENAPELFACPDVDGGLIGGASLKAAAFLSIVSAMVRS